MNDRAPAPTSRKPAACGRPRLVVHIGTHKTGTSTLQRALSMAAVALRAQGILYPRTDREPWPQLPKHCSVFHAAVQTDSALARAERDRLQQEFAAAEAQVMVISEEGLSESHPSLPEFFAPWLGTFDIEVVCYLRRQDLLVEALFNQFVREAARRESRPLAIFARLKWVRERLDYHAMLSRWRNLPAKVTALDFDAVRGDGGLLASFSEAAGLPQLPASPDLHDANRSPDMRLALALNRMNRSQLDYRLPLLMRSARLLESSGEFPRLKHLLGSVERRRLIAESAESNRRLAQDFEVAFSADLPVAEPSATTEDVEPAYLLALLARASSLD
jgi:hypothetical protein